MKLNDLNYFIRHLFLIKKKNYHYYIFCKNELDGIVYKKKA